jgi:hypothetical protein
MFYILIDRKGGDVMGSMPASIAIDRGLPLYYARSGNE